MIGRYVTLYIGRAVHNSETQTKELRMERSVLDSAETEATEPHEPTPTPGETRPFLLGPRARNTPVPAH